MTRSTKAQKLERLNAAYALLEQNSDVAVVVQRLSMQFGLSQRQAYRCVEAARKMRQPAEVAEASVPITLKIPGSLAAALRAHAKGSGLSIGEIVSRALSGFLFGTGRHG